jgi:hypothetical protein
VASLVAPLVAAHGSIPGAPKIFGLGRNAVADLKTRNIFAGHGHRAAAHASPLQARQGGLEGRCGKDFGCATCDEGYCCSTSGYCGKGQDYCQAPDSQFEYGPGADANKLPSGGSTKGIARPKLGSVQYGGEGIYVCSKPGQIAITYDDGPYIYTNDLLDLFASYGFKATFCKFSSPTGYMWVLIICLSSHDWYQPVQGRNRRRVHGMARCDPSHAR